MMSQVNNDDAQPASIPVDYSPGIDIPATRLQAEYSLQSDAGVAVIGMSCKFAGDASNPEKLWDLCANGGDAWSKVPKTRFNHDAFYHPDQMRLGMTHAQGGYFLKEDISVFDASFFGLTREIANAMDPQMRLMLESVFEAIENAGIPIETLSGSDTSVFAGSFFRDYADSQVRDTDTISREMLTGNNTAMLANRISHFLNLHGPSMTVDTGCSSSLTTVHLACQSLKLGEASSSVVTASNLLINPDNFIILSNLGVLGAGGKCRAWDRSADGYGRGEGIATMILKPLKQALLDGDPVRAVVRASAVNQDGKTNTITSPSMDAQMNLIRSCYRRANLVPSETAYVEGHMTGTATGDPIEAQAIGEVFGTGRSQGPVLVGSIKTNVGHTEATSGLAGMLKAVLAIEKGMIPPNTHFKNCNPTIDLKKLNLKVPTVLTPWPDHLPRRASVNNFGFGGANAHVILEGLESYQQTTSSPQMRSRHELVKTDYQKRTTESLRPKVMVLTAKSLAAVKAMAANLQSFLKERERSDENFDLDRLAYTLASRRSRFNHRLGITVSSLSTCISALDFANLKPEHCSVTPRICFVFTGQGAQWPQMGKELLAYPVFRNSLDRADKAFSSCGASWSIKEELLKDHTTSQVHDILVSIPVCVCLQLCLVDLLASWNIKPRAVVSHSSGEIAAAYTAGALTFEEAISVTYHRSVINERYIANGSTVGAMLAVGLGYEKVLPYLDSFNGNEVVVACVNSPESVTLSGPKSAIDHAAAIFRNEDVFARKLKVEGAFHSHHMLPMAPEFLEKLNSVLSPKVGSSAVTYASPVTGDLISDLSNLHAENWVNNMTQPVLFFQALEKLCQTNSKKDGIDVLIELGPHGALAGPIRQILQLDSLRERNIFYQSALTRNDDSALTVCKLAAKLFCQGYPVDLHTINFPQGSVYFKPLTDLPLYPWDHESSYWAESRLNRDHRFRQTVRHDLLGHRLAGCEPSNPIWRQFLRVDEMPWLRDHRVQGDCIFPAAGYVCTAIEAMRQISERSEKLISNYTIRDLQIKIALVIPEDSDGIESQLNFHQVSHRSLDDREWWQFTISSYTPSSESWVHHCKGMISSEASSFAAGDWKRTKLYDRLQNEATSVIKSWRNLDAKDFFKHMRDSGVVHGRAFKNIISIELMNCLSSVRFAIPDLDHMTLSDSLTPILHPTTLDSVFQAALCVAQTPGMMFLPRSIAKLDVSTQIGNKKGHEMRAVSQITVQNEKGFQCDSVVGNADDSQSNAVLEITDLICQAVKSSGTRDSIERRQRACFRSQWQLDWTLLSASDLRNTLRFQDDIPSKSNIADLSYATLKFIHDTIAQISESDVQDLAPHHRFLYEWMCKRDKKGHVDPKPNGCSEADLIERISNGNVDGQLLCCVGKNLLDILRQRVAPLELMMKDSLLYKYYENNTRQKRSHAHARRLVELFSKKTPRGNILEIGAGTGGCTSSVLAGLTVPSPSGDELLFAHYDFTDISSGFFKQAKEKFRKWSDLMSFRKLDISQNPGNQSFVEKSYDLIVASLVLHATENIQRTIQHVNKLLKPGGKLILIETTNDAIDMQLIFGTLPGWWAGAEEGRTESPNMSKKKWAEVLNQNGFTGIDFDIGDCDDEDNATFSTIISTSVGKKPRYPPEIQIIWPADHECSCKQQIWLANLRKQLVEVFDIETTVQSLQSQKSNARYCISLLDMFKPWLHQLDDDRLKQLQGLFGTVNGILWVSAGGIIEGQKPEYSLNTGFFNSLRLENTEQRVATLDLESKIDPWNPDNIFRILKILAVVFDLETNHHEIDCDFAVQNSHVYVTRLYENHEENISVGTRANPLLPKRVNFIKSPTPLKMEIAKRGSLDGIHFAEYDIDPLRQDYIEIQPKAFGVNFRDVLIALGRLDIPYTGYECSGTVVRVGKNISQFKPGDRVCTIMQGNFATLVQVHHSWASSIPVSKSFVEAASMPCCFLSAYYSLFTVGRLKANEKVLIHAACGGVGQATIMLAKRCGADIYATAGTDEKRQFLATEYGIPRNRIFSSRDASFAVKLMAATNGRGVDVVINSLSGDLLKQSWNCIAEFGRFVELGKIDIDTNKLLDMKPLGRGASFAGIDLNLMMQRQSDAIPTCMREVMSMWASGHIRPPTSITTYGISEIEKAFRTVQAGKHIGKIVCVPSAEDMVKVIPKVKSIRLNSEASYLIVGGLGGIGKEIALHLAKLQCRHLLILSRTAADNPSTNSLEKRLWEYDCRLVVRNCDVANRENLEAVIHSCYQHGIPQIRGIIHAGMTLDHALFNSMKHDQWRAASRPKVDASWNLHKTLPNLDFFITLSSLQGLGITAGQSSYGAGSTYQDGLVRYRRAHGLPATTIDLGAVEEVGYTAKTDGVMESLKEKDLDPISVSLVLRLLESVIRSPERSVEDSQILVGICNPDNVKDVSWRRDPRFSRLWQRKHLTTSIGERSAKRVKNFKDVVDRARTWNEVNGCFTNALSQKVADMFSLTDKEVDTSEPISRLGVDSLVAIELRTWLSAETRADISTFEILQAPSLTKLATKAAQISLHVDRSKLVSM